MKIVVDAFGGDNSPKEIVKGSIMAAKEYKEEIILVGNEEVIFKLLKELDGENCGISVVNATEIIDMHDDPSTALRRKKDSSMAVGLNLLKEDKADAIVSAGSTGALLTGATLFAKRIKGIRRGALAPIMATKTGKVLIIDSGANTECNVEYLLQFAYMGSIYMNKICGIASPRVGILNNGSESTKGTDLQKETYKLLEKESLAGRINFIGNVEGRDVPLGACDVVVSDGFTGNIFLKTIEGTAMLMAGKLKGMFKKNILSKIAYLMVKPGMEDIKRMLDSEETGGAPFLGISKAVIKAHGSSQAKGIKNAVGQAIAYVNSGITQEIESNISHMTFEKTQM